MPTQPSMSLRPLVQGRPRQAEAGQVRPTLLCSLGDVQTQVLRGQHPKTPSAQRPTRSTSVSQSSHRMHVSQGHTACGLVQKHATPTSCGRRQRNRCHTWGLGPLPRPPHHTHKQQTRLRLEPAERQPAACRRHVMPPPLSPLSVADVRGALPLAPGAAVGGRGVDADVLEHHKQTAAVVAAYTQGIVEVRREHPHRRQAAAGCGGQAGRLQQGGCGTTDAEAARAVCCRVKIKERSTNTMPPRSR